MGLFIRPSAKGFRVVEEQWKPERETKTVPRESYPALGFRYDMTIEEAKARAIQINQQSQLESKKIAGAVRRKRKEKAVNEAYLPKPIVEAFEDELHESYTDNAGRLDTVLKHWETAAKLISELALDPKDFFPDRTKIFNYYKKKKWSPDYIKRINKMLNLWGGFFSRRHNLFYQPIPKLSSVQVQKVVELREDQDGIRTAAEPLIWEDLKNKKETFASAGLEEQWNWMFIALWFGLRPLEVDNLVSPKFWNVTYDKDMKVSILNVYQTKLTSLSKEQRWKPIPVFFPEQKLALTLIENGSFKRPLNKTLSTPDRLGEGIETYSPRKGFTDLMLEKGFGLEDISVFLGHNNIETTWRHYKNKKKFKLPPTG